MNPRIRIMLDSRVLEESPAAEGEVEGMWRKAMRSWGSSAVAGLDADARFTLTYQSAFQAATAVIRSAGYRVRGDAHHHQTFAAVAALSLGDLSEAARDLNVIRQKRHGAIYDWETRLGDQDVDEIRTATRLLFVAAGPWLRTRHPAIEGVPTTS